VRSRPVWSVLDQPSFGIRRDGCEAFGHKV